MLRDTKQERTERKHSYHERVLPFTPLKERIGLKTTNPSLSEGSLRSVKQRTPPSLEKDSVAKKIHFEEDNMSGKKEETENKKDLTDLEQSEARILEKIEKMQIQLQTSINELKDE